MFPRPRKITRFLVFAFTGIFLFSSYVYIFSPSAARDSYDATQLDLIRSNMISKVRSVYSPNQNSDPMDFGADSADHTDEATSLNAQQFQNYVHSKFDNSKFFREKSQKCFDNIRTNHPKGFSDFQINSSSVSSKPVYTNPHNFAYIHNPSDICSKKPVSFLIYIHSSPVNLKKRQAIRQSWGDLKLLSLFNATLVFILGATHDKPTQRLVDMEANKYGDIVQEDFMDAYRNLTYKGMTALKWAANFCNCASFVFKADDDILLDIVSVIDHLITQVVPSHGSDRLVLCNLWTRMKAMRNKKSKWYLSKEEFPHDTFPPYCSGSFFIFSSDIIPDMYKTALNSKFFWVDDYFITGVLVNTLQIKHVTFNQVYLLNYNVVEERLKADRKEYLVFHIRQLSLFQRMWPLIMRRYEGMKSFLKNSFKPFTRNIFKSTKNHNVLNGIVDNVTMAIKHNNVTSFAHVSTRIINDVTQKAFTGRYPIV